MKDAIIGGRFVHADGTPVEGQIHFMPSKLWLEDKTGVIYACLAPQVELVDGRFSVALTRTDTYDFPWHYTAITPIGRFSIWVESDGPLNLKDLLPKTAT